MKTLILKVRKQRKNGDYLLVGNIQYRNWLFVASTFYTSFEQYLMIVWVRFEDQVSDFNFGTLIRTRSNEDYGPDNSFFVPRIQFVCIEIARNREGANISIYKNAALASAHKNDDTDEEVKIMEQEMQILQEKIVGNLN